MSDAASKPNPAKHEPTPTAPMRKRSEQTGPDLKTLTRAWLESHRASLLDSLRRLAKQPIGSFFTCLVMAVALSLPMGPGPAAGQRRASRRLLAAGRADFPVPQAGGR